MAAMIENSTLAASSGEKEDEEKQRQPLPGEAAYFAYIYEQRYKLESVRTEFAKRFGFKESHIRGIEEGRSYGSLPVIIKLAGLFDMRPGLLLDKLAGLDTAAEEQKLKGIVVPESLTPAQRESVRDFAAFLDYVNTEKARQAAIPHHLTNSDEAYLQESARHADLHPVKDYAPTTAESHLAT